MKPTKAINDILLERFIPVIPSSFGIYDSYTIDPEWQIKFTIIWTSVLAFTTLASLPWIFRAWKSGRLYSGLVIRQSDGSSNSPSPPNYSSHGKPLNKSHEFTIPGASVAKAIWQTLSLATIPLPNLRLAFWKSQIGDCCRRAYFTLTIGQIALVVVYVGAVIVCMTRDAELSQNSNRASFIGIATLPVIVLLSMKSPLPLPVFVPSLSYEHYNFLHRWAGRTLFLCISVHGGIWLNQFITTNQWDQVWAVKTQRGMIAYGLLGGIVITSLKPVRRMYYQLFWFAHVCLFVGFFAAICYHSPYAQSWVIPCAALYAYDLLVRMLRFRIKDAVIIPVDQSQTMVYIPDCDAGWLPTQHIFLRVFRGPGIFESHPFTITNSPGLPHSSTPRGIILYAKNCGDWTRRLHAAASDMSTLAIGEVPEEQEAFLIKEKEAQGTSVPEHHPGKKVTVMVDGPYGGLKLQLERYEEVLVVAGGSGVTYLLGTIEEALRVWDRGSGPKKMKAAWVVAEYSAVKTLAPTLARLSTLAARAGMSLEYQIFFSRPPSPLPSIPDSLSSNTTFNPYRPEVAQLVRETLPTVATDKPKGLAVVACGPEGLVQEARNAVAGLSITERVRCGGVDFHGECYAL